MNVIIVDGDYERSSSSVEDETMPMISSNPTLLSPITTNEIKTTEVITPPLHNTKPVTPMKSEKVNTDKTLQSLWIRIQLNKLNINGIPTLRKHLEATRPWLLEPKVSTKLSPKISPKLDETPAKKEKQSTNSTDGDCKPKETKEIKNEVPKETRTDVTARDVRGDIAKDVKNDTRKTPLFEEIHRDRKHKSKKRKRRNSSSSISSHSTISNLSQNSRLAKLQTKECDNSKSKKVKNDTESRLLTENLNFTTTPPTNHERETNNIQSSKSSSLTSPSSKPRSTRPYRSYFEPPDEPADLKKR